MNLLQVIDASRCPPLNISNRQRLIPKRKLLNLNSLNIIRLLQVINHRLQQSNEPILNPASINFPELHQHHVHPLHRLFPLQILLEGGGGELRPWPGSLLPVLPPPLPPRPELVADDADEEEEGEETNRAAVEWWRGDGVDSAELSPELVHDRIFSVVSETAASVTLNRRLMR